MWTMLVLKLIGSVLLIFAGSLVIDWIFSGSKWAQKYFSRAPEIWRSVGHEGSVADERRVVRTSLLMTLVYSLSFFLFYFVMRPGLIFTTPLARAFATATFLWLLLPFPLLVTQHLYVKYHRATTTMQLVGWYMKLLTASLLLSFLF